MNREVDRTFLHSPLNILFILHWCCVYLFSFKLNESIKNQRSLDKYTLLESVTVYLSVLYWVSVYCTFQYLTLRNLLNNKTCQSVYDINGMPFLLFNDFCKHSVYLELYKYGKGYLTHIFTFGNLTSTSSTVDYTRM